MNPNDDENPNQALTEPAATTAPIENPNTELAATTAHTENPNQALTATTAPIDEGATLRAELQEQRTKITAIDARLTDFSNTINALTDAIRGMTNPPLLTPTLQEGVQVISHIPSEDVRRDTNDSSLKKDKEPASSTHSDLEPSHEESTQNTVALSVGKFTSSELENKLSSSTQSEVVITHTSTSTPTEVQVMLNQPETSIDEHTKIDKISPQYSEADDLDKLFLIMEEKSDIIGVLLSHVSENIDGEVAKAFVDLEASMKMNLNEIASSEENIIRLQNALDFLSTGCSENLFVSSPSLKPTINFLQQEIPRVLSSFKHASARLAFIEEREKYLDEDLPLRKRAAKTLISEIRKTEKSMEDAQRREAGLKEEITKLQAELNSKDREIKDYEMKLSFLQKQKKTTMWDTMERLEEYEAVKKERSQIEKWSSELAKSKKSTLLQGIFILSRSFNG